MQFWQEAMFGEEVLIHYDGGQFMVSNGQTTSYSYRSIYLQIKQSLVTKIASYIVIVHISNISSNNSQIININVLGIADQVPIIENSEGLPLVYDPDTISAYWGSRATSVVTRIVQLTSVAGGFLSHLAWDLINKKVKEVRVLFCNSHKNLMPVIVVT